MVRILLAIIVVGLFSGSTAQGAATIDTGAKIYEILRQRGLLEGYMLESVDELAGTLIAAARRWPGYGVNRPYVPGNVNIYLVKGSLLPEKNVLDEIGVDLARHSLQGNAIAHEKTGILFVDSELLKSLVTVAILVGEGNLSTLKAVAAVKAYGIDAFKQLWDPTINSAIENAEYTDNWVQFASGAAAFVFAHEIGHIYIGADNESRRRRPMRFKSNEDKDKHWVCDDLVDQKYRQQQRIEKESDDYAVSLLARVLYPEGVLDKPLLRYELGAHWYILYSLGEQMVESLYATESQNILNALRMLLGVEIYQELRAKRKSTGRGSVHVFFPKSHPANIRRASVSLDRLAQSPYSSYYGETPSTAADISRFEMLLAIECKNLKDKYGRK